MEKMINKKDLQGTTIAKLKEMAMEFGIKDIKKDIKKDDLVDLILNSKKTSIPNADKMELGEQDKVKDFIGGESDEKFEEGYPVGKDADNDDVDNDDIVDLTTIPTTTIDIDTLMPSNYNFFKPLSEKKYNELVNSIKSNGMLVPPIVRPIGGGLYEILAGHNRVKAGKEIGMKQVSAKIVEVSDDKAKEIIIDTNVAQRLEMTPMEIAKAYDEKIKILGNRRGKRTDLVEGSENDADAKGSTRDLIGQQYGKSGMTIDRYLRLNKLTPEFQNMIDTETLPVKVGFELGLLGNEVQSEILNFAKEDLKALTTGKVSKIKKLVKEKEKEAKEKNLPSTPAITKKDLETVFHGSDDVDDTKPKKVELVIPADFDKETATFIIENIKDDPMWFLNIIKDFNAEKLVYVDDIKTNK